MKVFFTLYYSAVRGERGFAPGQTSRKTRPETPSRCASGLEGARLDRSHFDAVSKPVIVLFHGYS